MSSDTPANGCAAGADPSADGAAAQDESAPDQIVLVARTMLRYCPSCGKKLAQSGKKNVTIGEYIEHGHLPDQRGKRLCSDLALFPAIARDVPSRETWVDLLLDELGPAPILTRDLIRRLLERLGVKARGIQMMAVTDLRRHLIKAAEWLNLIQNDVVILRYRELPPQSPWMWTCLPVEDAERLRSAPDAANMVIR